MNLLSIDQRRQTESFDDEDYPRSSINEGFNNDSSNFDIIHDVASTSDNCSSWRPLDKEEEKQEMIFMYVNG